TSCFECFLSGGLTERNRAFPINPSPHDDSPSPKLHRNQTARCSVASISTFGCVRCFGFVATRQRELCTRIVTLHERCSRQGDDMTSTAAAHTKYQTQASDYDKAMQSLNYVQSMQAFIRWRRLLGNGDGAGRSVLDLGCGSGFAAAALAENYP